MSTPPDHTHISVYDDHDDNGEKGGTNRASGKSKYTKFNKEKHDRVVFWIKVTIFSLGVVGCVLSLTVPSLRKICLREIALWRWCVLVTSLLAGLVLSQALQQLVLLLVEHEFSIKENTIYYIAGTIESAWVVLWCGAILLAWTWVVDAPSNSSALLKQNAEKAMQRFASTTRIITLTLVTILLGSLLWLVKSVLMKVGKSSFHIRRFFVRVRNTLKDKYMIKTLSEVRSYDTRIQPEEAQGTQNININIDRSTRPICPSSHIVSKLRKVGSKKKGYIQKTGDGGKEKRVVDLRSLEKVDEENVSCWGMKILINDIVNGEPLGYIDHYGNEKFINDENDAIQAADVIFSAMFPYEDSSTRMEEVIQRYFDDREKSPVISWLYEGSVTQEINREVFRKRMVRALKYRTSLVQALTDNRRMIQTLNIFVNVFLVLIIFVIWLVMIRVEIRRAMVVVGSIIVGSAVIFGDFCKKLLDNFAFVFFVHPFDIGDCCFIEGTPVIIDRINLLSTIAVTLDSNEVRHYPNATLCRLTIINYTRSPSHMGDSVVFYLPLSKSQHQMRALESQIKSYIEENKNYWRPEHELVMELESKDATTNIKATLRFKHNINFHDLRERELRKTKLILQLKKILDGLDDKPEIIPSSS